MECRGKCCVATSRRDQCLSWVIHDLVGSSAPKIKRSWNYVRHVASDTIEAARRPPIVSEKRLKGVRISVGTRHNSLIKNEKKLLAPRRGIEPLFST